MKDIERWLKKGFIDENLAQILSEDLIQAKEKRCKIAAQIVLYTIGAILLGTGVVCFVSANNWLLELLERQTALQTSILLAIALISLWLGWNLGYEKKNFPGFGNALVFLSALLIGAAYIQIGQAYNWDENSSSVLILWLLSILPLAFIFKSTPVNWLSIILFAVTYPYIYYELQLDDAEVWTVYIPLTLGAILYTFANLPFLQDKYNKFSFQYKISALIPIFFTFLVLIFSVEKSYQMQNIYYFAVPVILILINIRSLIKSTGNIVKFETAFLIFMMIFVLDLIMVNNINPVFIMFLAHILLISIISLVQYWGYKFENTSLINLGNTFILIYLLSVYCRYGWNYMDKTLFFILGGLGLTGGGIFLEKYKQKVAKITEAEQQ